MGLKQFWDELGIGGKILTSLFLIPSTIVLSLVFWDTWGLIYGLFAVIIYPYTSLWIAYRLSKNL